MTERANWEVIYHFELKIILLENKIGIIIVCERHPEVLSNSVHVKKSLDTPTYCLLVYWRHRRPRLRGAVDHRHIGSLETRPHHVCWCRPTAFIKDHTWGGGVSVDTCPMLIMSVSVLTSYKTSREEGLSIIVEESHETRPLLSVRVCVCLCVWGGGGGSAPTWERTTIWSS